MTPIGKFGWYWDYKESKEWCSIWNGHDEGDDEGEAMIIFSKIVTAEVNHWDVDISLPRYWQQKYPDADVVVIEMVQHFLKENKPDVLTVGYPNDPAYKFLLVAANQGKFKPFKWDLDYMHGLDLTN